VNTAQRAQRPHGNRRRWRQYGSAWHAKQANTKMFHARRNTSLVRTINNNNNNTQQEQVSTTTYNQQEQNNNNNNK